MMKQRPERAVGITVVIFVDVLGLEIDEGDGHAGPLFNLEHAGERLDRFARPPEPQAVVGFQGR